MSTSEPTPSRAPSPSEVSEYVILRIIRQTQFDIISKFLNTSLRHDLKFPLPNLQDTSHAAALAQLRAYIASNIRPRRNDFDTNLQSAINAILRKYLMVPDSANENHPLVKAVRDMTNDETHSLMSDFSICDQAINNWLSSREALGEKSDAVYERCLPELIAQEATNLLGYTEYFSPALVATTIEHFYVEAEEFTALGDCAFCKKPLMREDVGTDGEHRPVRTLCEPIGHVVGRSCLARFVGEEYQRAKDWKDKWFQENVDSLRRDMIEKEMRGEWRPKRDFKKPPKPKDKPAFYACPVCGDRLRRVPEEQRRYFVAHPYRWELRSPEFLGNLWQKNTDEEVLDRLQAFVMTLPPRPDLDHPVESINVGNIYRTLFNPSKVCREDLGSEADEEVTAEEPVNLTILMYFLSLDRFEAYVRRDWEAMRRAFDAQVRVLARQHWLEFRRLLKERLSEERLGGLVIGP